MLTIEMVSGSDIFKFKMGQSMLVYINEDQIIMVRIAKLLNRKNFHILIDGKKVLINEVRITSA